ncbi:ribonuclease HII [Agrilactobacillus composti]|uniref:ribonuclease HII n=1 Tax=Agrilactobacillus composti TaxID=398555 RepID=UPI0005528C7C|nr:ribonuclease HII [Agrilactobacillus composti]
MTIAAVRVLLASGELSDAKLTVLQADKRKGVQQLLAHYHRQQFKLAQAQAAFKQRCQLEQRYWAKNQLVAGIDEVGRGPLAGPVVTCAIVLAPDFNLVAVNDSKQLADHQRRELFTKILSECYSCAIGYADNQAIDRFNIYEATRQAMGKAVAGLTLVPSGLLVDAMTVPTAIPQEKLIHGDARSVSIAAASIVAKVLRDDLMKMYDSVYPGYGFSKNMGYGTAAHLQGLQQLGPTPIHRHSFAPVRQYEK